MSWIDGAILLVYFTAIVGVGLYAGRREKDSRDFLVGGRSVPWPAVLGSIVATEVSAATFLAVPGVGFSENMNYLQFGIGSLAARFFIAFIFIGAFFSAECFSIYEYLRKRFGHCSQYTASAYFLVTRLLSSGVRLMIAASGVSVILDIPLSLCLLVFAVLTIVYTATGGIKAVIWTDCIQAVVFLSAGIGFLTYLIYRIGWNDWVTTATDAGRFEVLRFSSEEGSDLWTLLADPQWFWIAVLFGFVSSAAAFGTDQDSTQRMLSCRNASQARRSLILSGFVAIPVATLFLLIGTALFAFYQLHPDPALPESADEVFPWFIIRELPVGLKGLLLTGVVAAAMSSLDSAMAALGSSAVVDLIKPLRRQALREGQLLWLSRALTVVFAATITLIAWILQDGGRFLWLAFQITAITYSGLLGVFLLGLLTRRGSDVLNLFAMLAGSSLVILLLVFDQLGRGLIGWTWFLFLGTLVTFTIGLFGNSRSTDSHHV